MRKNKHPEANGVGMLRGDHIMELIDSCTNLPDSVNFDELNIPFRCVAYDMQNKKEVVMDRGNLPLAVRASMAIPGAFKPVRLNDMVLLDGGLINNLPVDVVRQMGADIVIAIDLTQHKKETRDISVGIGGLLDWVISRPDLIKYNQNVDSADIYINPILDGYGVTSFNRNSIEVMIDLGERLLEELGKAGVLGLYDKMEEPLIRVLARMETAGIRMDLDSLRDFAAKLREEIARRETAIREMAGEPDLNVGSPKQIGVVLFEKLGLDKKAKKSASGQYTTDETTLLALSDKHPIIGEILEYRAAKKLLSTYIEPFPSYVSPADGKIHTTFNQALTATGRLSSSNPNLQNIPIRTERGREIRKAFVPGTPDGVIVSADYSQIELRIMAHLSCDEHLVSAFREGMDVHRATAAKIFHIPPEEVTKEQRGIAKTANFGIMYGISAFGLAQRLGSSRFAAKKIIDDYFENFPSISSYIEAAIAGARENGYVETLFGRRRYLPDINARNANARALAERNAVNAPIQGTSADIIKLAMIAVDRRIREEGLRSRMVLQIHDELVFDAVPEEVSRLKEIVVHEMEHVMELSVTLTVECNEGKNWLEAH